MTGCKYYLRAKLNDKNMPKSVKNRTLNVTQHFVDGWPSETNPYPIPADPLDQHRGTKPVRKRPTAREPLPARKRKKTVSEDPRVEAAESLISLSQQIPLCPTTPEPRDTTVSQRETKNVTSTISATQDLGLECTSCGA